MAVLAACCMLLFCGGCATSWPVYSNGLTRDQIRRDKSNETQLALAVKAAPEAEFREGWSSVPPEKRWVENDMRRAVSNLVADLGKTGLFKSVNSWTPELRFDVLVEARRADGVIRCSTPFAMRPFTLYLLSGESRYHHMYELRFRAVRGSERVDLKRDYEGSYYAPSILLLPFLSWQRRTTEVDLLRHDLIPLLSEIEALKTARVSEQQSGEYSPSAARSIQPL